MIIESSACRHIGGIREFIAVTASLGCNSATHASAAANRYRWPTGRNDEDDYSADRLLPQRR
jgi:hypothetical protein